MNVDGIKSLYRRQLSTHQSLAPVIEALIEHLEGKERDLEFCLREIEALKVPAPHANQVAPGEKLAEASEPQMGDGEAETLQE